MNSVEFFARTLPRNPRKIKRFVNQYRLLAYIADRRGLFAARRVDLEGLGSIVVLASEYPEIHALLSTRNFSEKLLNIINWGTSAAAVSDALIERYRLVPDKERYKDVLVLLSKLRERESAIQDYLSLSSIVANENVGTKKSTGLGVEESEPE